jgi:hypothetical protein
MHALGNFFHRFEKSPAIGEAKILPRAAGAFGFDRRGPIAKHWRRFEIVLAAQPETRRHAILEYLQKQNSPPGVNAARLVMRMRVPPAMPNPRAMRMAMTIAAART